MTQEEMALLHGMAVLMDSARLLRTPEGGEGFEYMEGVAGWRELLGK